MVGVFLFLRFFKNLDRESTCCLWELGNQSLCNSGSEMWNFIRMSKSPYCNHFWKLQCNSASLPAHFNPEVLFSLHRDKCHPPFNTSSYFRHVVEFCRVQKPAVFLGVKNTMCPQYQLCIYLDSFHKKLMSDVFVGLVGTNAVIHCM